MKRHASDEDAPGKEKKRHFPSLHQLARKKDAWHRQRERKGK